MGKLIICAVRSPRAVEGQDINPEIITLAHRFGQDTFYGDRYNAQLIESSLPALQVIAAIKMGANIQDEVLFGVWDGQPDNVTTALSALHRPEFDQDTSTALIVVSDPVFKLMANLCKVEVPTEGLIGIQFKINVMDNRVTFLRHLTPPQS